MFVSSDARFLCIERHEGLHEGVLNFHKKVQSSQLVTVVFVGKGVVWEIRLMYDFYKISKVIIFG